MKKWKSTASLLLALVLAGNMAACGSGKASDSSAAGAYAAEESYSVNGGWDAEMKAEADLTDTAAEAAGDAALTEEELDSAEAEKKTSERKLIRNMDLSLETMEFDTLLSVIEEKTASIGGYIESSSVEGTPEEGRRNSYLTVRVPADQLEEFEKTLGDAATVLSKSSDVRDVTLSYSDLSVRISSLRVEQQTLMDMLAKAERIEDIIAIQNELTSIRYELESYESQMKVMENQISYSTVTINIREVKVPTVQEKEGFFSRLKYTFVNSISDLREGIEDFLVFFLGNIFSIILFLAVFVGILYLIRAVFRFLFGKGKKEKKERPEKRRGFFRKNRKQEEDSGKEAEEHREKKEEDQSQE